MIKLVAFLGNHGQNYAKNRHNAGWIFAEQLPFYNLLDWKHQCKGLCARIDGEKILPYARGDRANGNALGSLIFLKPETFMNLSGTSLAGAAAFFKIDPEEMLIVHDELELPLGTVSLKFSGGLGGHNGLRSIKSCLGTADFWRLRIGIGRPVHHDISSWVLSDFSPDEEAIVSEVLRNSTAPFISALMDEPKTLLPEWAKKKLI